MGLLRVKIIGAMVAAILGLAAPAYACLCCPWTEAGDATGCSASSPASPPAIANECGYHALTSGDIAGRGAWRVSIQRGGHRITYRGKDASPVAVLHGVIQPGDTVTVVAGHTGAASAGPLAEQQCPLI